MYSPRLRALARQAEPGLAEGVYAALHGPHYETPAEIRMLRGAGADMVGMSTALEAIAARHLGAEVLGISLITNPAAGLSAAGLDHAEVIAAGRESAARVGALLAQILPGSCRGRRPGRPGGRGVISDDLHREVLAWIADDPDERDRAELSALLRSATGADSDEAEPSGRRA